MKIETKYSIDHMVYYLDAKTNKAVVGRISGIQTLTDSAWFDDVSMLKGGSYITQGTHVHYTAVNKDSHCERLNESDIFLTKEELIQSIKSKADLL